ncbi:MAG TPA: acyl-CoA reductase [Puia sp.]
MDLKNRIRLLVELGQFMQSDEPRWLAAKTRAFQQNAWFIPEFITGSADQIVDRFLQQELLEKWAGDYDVPALNPLPKKAGIVMAGNIPLVGFHDFLSGFLSGHQAFIKLSSKDPWLFPEILDFLYGKNPELTQIVQPVDVLRGMDAYIATGSNNSARYFEYYFAKYPSLIRRNRTSVAILDGTETPAELDGLADDVFLYFGLGCRNVSQILVPENYDFIPLLQAFRKYQWMADHNKYKNNFDYRLSLAILNKLEYMTNDCILLLQDDSPFSPISVLHYAFYKEPETRLLAMEKENLQCIVGRNYLPFGKSQQPGLSDYADGADTMRFFQAL